MKKADLYIHIPFCFMNCSYCYFYSEKKFSEKLLDSYIDYLEKEIRLRVSKKYSLETIYVGGGSPNVLSNSQIERLTSLISSNFSIKDLKEFTFEFNPSFWDYEKLKTLKNCGVTRLSLGIQSTNQKMMEILGRCNDFEKIVNNINNAKKLGFILNLDFIFNIPFETIREINSDLSFISKNSPDSVYFYPLNYQTDKMRSLIKNSLGEKGVLALRLLISKKMKSLGYFHSLEEFFSKTNKVAQYTYNWIGENELIGLGPFAISRDDKKWSKNISDIQGYFSSIDAGKFPTSEVFEPSAKESSIFDFSYYIRFGKLDINKFEKKLKFPVTKAIKEEIEIFKQKRWIYENKNFLSLTKKGLLNTSKMQKIIIKKSPAIYKKFENFLGRVFSN